MNKLLVFISSCTNRVINNVYITLPNELYIFIFLLIFTCILAKNMKTSNVYKYFMKLSFKSISKYLNNSKYINIFLCKSVENPSYPSINCFQ